MRIKIHMLDVGNADALILELTDAFDNNLNILVDGGKQNHSKRINEYLKSYRIVPEIIICTHLDNDHVGGLKDIVREYKSQIRYVLAHLPENHNKKVIEEIIEKASMDERFEKIYASINDLREFVEVVRENNIPIIEPFSDEVLPHDLEKLLKVWKFKILSPSRSFYEKQLGSFRDFKHINESEDTISAMYNLVNKPCSNLGKGNITPENESSVIFEISSIYKKFLFAGDAGLVAFSEIKEHLDKIYWLKCPHHGSKKNLNEEIIKKLSPEKVFISADTKKFPSYELVSCLREFHSVDVKITGESGNLIENVQ